LDKIIASRTFAASARISQFLRFVVEHSLSSPASRLKESVIGVGVFERSPSYDPQSDPIVRVEARRLRSKLMAYYESEGREDSVRIELPKGSYTASFQITGAGRGRLDLSPEHTIVVLPFTDLSSEAHNEYFSDGLTEELIHALTKVAGIRVVAWHSASQLKGREQDIRGIRDQLNVRFVLRGSVRWDSKSLRITAQLIATDTGHYLWSEAYDRPPCDLFSVQEEIAAKIVNTLQLRLVQPPAPVQSRSTTDIECFNLCLQGRFHWNKRTRDGLRKSVDCFEAAILRDKCCATAYSGLADALAVMTEYGFIPPSESMARAKSAALKALELDPSSAEAYTSLGLIRSSFEWKWAEAESFYRRAIELNPGYATAHHWFSVDYLAMLGRTEEARIEIEIARQLDPLSAIIMEGRAFLYLLSREYDAALNCYLELQDLDDLFYKVYSAIGRVYTQQGKYDQAIEMFEKGRKLGGDVPSLLGALGQACALAGRTDQARQLLAELSRLSEARYVPSTCFAITHLGLGELDKAMTWLELACERHELPVMTMKVHPVYDPLRNEPAFQSLLRRIGFMD
jgi:serine/threonine-protein kinase